MNIQITADVVTTFGVIGLIGERAYRLVVWLKNSNNGNGKNGNGKNGKSNYVSYKDLMDHSTFCSSGIHTKINEYHNDIKDSVGNLGERISSLEAKI